MKPNFALSLSFDGLRLMHRVDGGWHLVGQVALDDADLNGALAKLRDAAKGLEPAGLSTKLLIPNDQIKYIALDTTRAEDEDVWAALEGATPYALQDLAYDYAKGGGRTYVAAVAKETLAEAQQFATEHGFNPVSFAAVPEPFTYVGEAFFGATDGNTAERDAEPVIVIGTADVGIAAPEPVVAPVEDPAPVDAPEPAGTEPVEAERVEAEAEAVEVEDVPVDAEEAVVDSADEPDTPADEAEPEAPAAEVEPDVPADDVEPEAPAGEPDVEETVESVDEPEVETVEPDVEVEASEQDTDSGEDVQAEAEVETPDSEVPNDSAPMFASRLRADRSEGAPAVQSEPETPMFSARRTEPTLGRTPPPALAVPTGKSTDAMPPVAAPPRDEAPVTTETPAPAITTDAPPPESAPAITGEAATALPAGAAVAAASLAVEPDTPDEDGEAESKSAAATALGAATAVGGAVGGMFASRRMARANAKSKAAEAETTAKDDRKSRVTVFGARKQPKPKPVVGGKPRFLGLILTAVLLLFLLAIGVFAAVSEEGFARWFGFGSSDTQMAEDPASSDPVDVAASEVAAVQPDGADEPALASDALATPTAPTGGQVLSPEEATRIYAATGVWQRAPRIPLTPRTTSIEALVLGSAPQSVPRVPPSPLASASSVAGDALIATPIDPPAPDTTFDFGSDGLVVATPDGAVTPDGIVVIVGRPALNPPTRPGTVAPEITPQDQLASVIPEEAETVEDAPEGVIIISGRPSIEPPIRTGTVAPAVAPVVAAIEDGTAPLVATDGLLVLAGTPPVLPPVRPGSVAAPTAPETPQAPETVEETPQDTPAIDAPEGLNVIAGPPPILPPARPGTVAPQDEAADVDTLTNDVAQALLGGTAQTPTADTPRPLERPAAIIAAAAQAVQDANAPALGALTVSEAAGFRPRTRPAGLAPVPDAVPDPDPDPEPDTAVVEAPAPPTGLQISPEIAAAVEAAANRPNPIVNPTAQAVATSERPDTRPRNMARIVQRAAAAQERAATQVAAVPQAAAVAPSGPTAGSVAQNATLENAINLRQINLIGIFGGNNDRRALVRLSNGRMVRVAVGDRLDGGRVTAISASALSYTKSGRSMTLQVAG